MRAFASCSIVAVLAASVAAAPSSKPLPSRKGADPDTTPDQLHHMAKAVVLDKAGDLERAMSEYRDALEKDQTPQPAIYWNLADLARRRDKFKDAVEYLTQYQALVKTDAERAAAQKVIDAIKATPYRVSIPTIHAELTSVYIDGVLAGTAPLSRELPPGRHVIDLISAEHFINRDVIAKPMTVEAVGIPSPMPPKSEGGNVIVSTSPEWTSSTSWRDGVVEYWLPGRMKLPAGHYETEIGGPPDRGRPPYACSLLAFDVAKDDITYLYLQGETKKQYGDCQAYKVKTQKVVLP